MTTSRQNIRIPLRIQPPQPPAPEACPSGAVALTDEPPYRGRSAIHFGDLTDNDLKITGVVKEIGEVGPVTDGIQTVFTFTLDNQNVFLNSVTIHAPSRADTTDDGAGNLTGADVSSGTLVYADADIITLTYTTPPAAGTLTIDYSYQV